MKPWFAQRPLFFAAAAYLFGILLGERVQKSEFLILGAALFLIGLYILARWKKAGGALLLAGVFLFGMGAIAAKLSVPAPPGGEITLTGRISEVSRGEKTTVYRISDAAADGNALSVDVLLSAPGIPLATDDYVWARATLRLPDGQRFQNGFNDRLYCAQKNAGYRGYTQKLLATGRAADITSFINGLRMKISQGLDESFGEQAPLAKAILFGDKDDLSEETTQTFRQSGLAHLTVVSGLHVQFFAAMFYALLRLLRAGRKTRFYTTLGVLLAYAALTGFGASVVRATIMCVLGLTAELRGRQKDMPTTLAAAFLFLTIGNPAAVFGAGFQLSFGAVFALCCLATRLPVRTLPGRAALSSAAAVLGTAPILLGISSEFSPLCLIANTIMIPLYSIAFPILMISAWAGIALGGGSLLAGTGKSLLQITQTIAGWFAKDGFLIPTPPGWLLLLLFGMMLLWSPYVTLKWKTKLGVFASVCAAVTAAVLLFGAREERLIFLDGGATAIVQTKQTTMVISPAEPLAEYAMKNGLYADVTIQTGEDDPEWIALARAGKVLDARIEKEGVLWQEGALKLFLYRAKTGESWLLLEWEGERICIFAEESKEQPLWRAQTVMLKKEMSAAPPDLAERYVIGWQAEGPGGVSIRKYGTVTLPLKDSARISTALGGTFI